MFHSDLSNCFLPSKSNQQPTPVCVSDRASRESLQRSRTWGSKHSVFPCQCRLLDLCCCRRIDSQRTHLFRRRFFVELMPFKQSYEKLKRVSADTLQKVALKQENKLASHRKVYTVRCMPLTLASQISVYVHTGVHRGIPQGQDPRKGR